MFIDIGHEVRTGGEFADKLRRIAQEFQTLQTKAEHNASYTDQANDALLRFVRHCKYNFFFLVSYYFPRYFDGKPLSFKLYPFVSTAFNFMLGGYTVYRGSRQISKSTGLSVRHILLANLLPGYKALYICPRTDQLMTYANKLRETERAFRYFKGISNKDQRSNLFFKEIGTGPVRSTLELAHVLSDAGNIRGRTVIELDIDECQGFDPDLETEVSQVNSATQMPITIYAGTSTTTETFLEHKYQNSSMGIWSIRCPSGHINIPLMEHGILDMIQPQGPTCVKCKSLMDVNNGEFVHAQPRMIDMHQVGFHVPQIIIPAVVNNIQRWQQIVNRKLSGNMTKFNQELLGIPSEEGTRELSRKQLEDICTLGPMPALQQAALGNKYIYIVSGCDWGGTEFSLAEKLKVSTTVHVVMGILPTGEFDILHMRRYLGMNFEDQVEDIMKVHQVFKAMGIASDAGVGMAYNREIRRYTLPDKHLIFGYVGPRSAYLTAPKEAHDINQWSLNKSDSITVLFQAIKSCRIRCYAWVQAQEHLVDFLNMYRAISEAPGGASTFVYRGSASKPNDTVQAMNYAFTIGKILLGEPVFSDSSSKARVEAGLKGTYSIQPGRRNMRPISG